MKNSVTEAYYAALEVATGSQGSRISATSKCPGCSRPVGPTRLSDGVTAWCSAGCRDAVAKRSADEDRRRYLVQHGWSAERWAAARSAR